MKAIVVLSALSALFASSAHAVFDPSWERPIESASLKIVEATGVHAEARAARLTLTKRDGESQATGLSIEIDGKVLDFVITKVGSAGCGSKEIIATQVIPANVRLARLSAIRLVDHATRLCEDYRPFRWEGTLTTQSRLHSDPAVSELRFTGNPEAIVTIQDF